MGMCSGSGDNLYRANDGYMIEKAKPVPRRVKARSFECVMWFLALSGKTDMSVCIPGQQLESLYRTEYISISSSLAIDGL